MAIKSADDARTDLREHVSFCRICSAGCGTVVSLGSDGRIASIRGDRDNHLSRGYACFKGLQSVDSHNGSARLLRPIVRQADGEWTEQTLDEALDAIADKLRAIIAKEGPDAVAVFCGNGSLLHATAYAAQRAFIDAIGSKQFFTTLTIDQSAKLVSFGRLGAWAAGSPELAQMDAVLIFGSNPLISHSSLGVLTADPVKRLKDARNRGLKMIVVDPRRSETAVHADLFLQPYPGWDGAIAGAMIRIILAEGWHDCDFCKIHVGEERMSALTRAVDPLDEDTVELASGLIHGQIRAAARLFAHESRTGIAYGATGPNMARHSNLAQHMIDCLNVVCGRFLRAGDPVTQVNVQEPLATKFAMVVGADRPWEKEPPSRIRGAGMLYGERLSATLADEILTPGEGQIRALIVVGGDPATSLPNQSKAIAALRDLELLVSIDPWLGTTASLAHHVLPPLLQYERSDVTAALPGFPLWPGKWAQYTSAVVAPPPGSDLADDWFMLWGLARRLGLSMIYGGKRALDMSNPPSTESLIEIAMDGAVLPFKTLEMSRHGVEFDLPDLRVEPAPGGVRSCFDVMPDDISRELTAVTCETINAAETLERPFILTTRRMRDFFNSNGRHNEPVRRRNPFNPLYMNPKDMVAIRAATHSRVSIRSRHGEATAIVVADPSLREGVVALAHGWGGLRDESFEDTGTCVNRLTSDVYAEAINAMPQMSGIPIDVRLTHEYTN